MIIYYLLKNLKTIKEKSNFLINDSELLILQYCNSIIYSGKYFGFNMYDFAITYYA